MAVASHPGPLLSPRQRRSITHNKSNAASNRTLLLVLLVLGSLSVWRVSLYRHSVDPEPEADPTRSVSRNQHAAGRHGRAKGGRSERRTEARAAKEAPKRVVVPPAAVVSKESQLNETGEASLDEDAQGDNHRDDAALV
jgi:hypothetical protein